MEDNQLSKGELARLKKENPKAFDPLKSYGIIARQKRPADTVYWLGYDSEKCHLKLNGWVIKRFNFESNADLAFKKLFKQKGWEKRITLTKPARTGVIVNNTGIPLQLRNAIFDEGNKETVLVAHTVIRRSRAQNFGVNDNEIQEYLVKMREKHDSLLKNNKRK